MTEITVNWAVMAVSLAASLLSVPVYAENRSFAHLYSWIFIQLATSVGLGLFVPPEITWQSCGLLVSSHATYLLSWLIGSTADAVHKRIVIKRGDYGQQT